MASPSLHADETLKALSRYLAGHPRVLWRYPRQEWTGKVWGLTDSNWAACPVTRKSTSATYLMLGEHPIFAGSSTQTILSLSSREAEFYGAVRCACRTLATPGHVWTGQRRRSSEASVEHGRSASGGLRTWLRYVCTTLSELQFERGSLFPCSLDQALFRLRWISFRDHCCLAPKKCLLEFTRFSDLGLRFQSFCPD